MRRLGLGAAVLLGALLSWHVALADPYGSRTDVAGSAALRVPRFSSTAWINAGKNPFRMVAADLNGDDNADLAVVEWSAAAVSVRFGDGTGQFRARSKYRTAPRPAGLAASDLNGDGKLDLVIASKGAAKSITVFLNRGAGRFRRAGAYAAGRDAYGVAAGDVNGDGVADLLSAHANRNHFTVLLGGRAGGFRIAHRYRGGRAYDIAAADLNSDGKLDVALADGSNGAVTVRLGRGDGTFGDPAVHDAGSAYGITVADLNHDSKLDIATANYPGAFVSVQLGAGDGTFASSVNYPMGEDDFDYVDAVLVADLDRDGHLDLATPGQPWVRRGRGDGTFERRQRAFDGFAFTQAGAVADFNGDRWPDLAFSEACDEVEVSCDEYPARSIAILLNWTGRRAPPCVVPAIVGATERRARRTLARHGCRIGHVRRRYSGGRRNGTVIRQRPNSASVRPNNSPVNLVVSRR